MAARQILPCLLVAVLVAASWADEGCGDEDVWNKADGYGCIARFHERNLKLPEAKEKCDKLHGALPKPASLKELRALDPRLSFKSYPKLIHYWLAPMTSHGGQITWADGEPLTWTYWGPEHLTLTAPDEVNVLSLRCEGESDEDLGYFFEFYKKLDDGSYDRYNPVIIIPDGDLRERIQSEPPKYKILSRQIIGYTDLIEKYSDGYFICKNNEEARCSARSLAVGVEGGKVADVPICGYFSDAAAHWVKLDPVDCGQMSVACAYCVKQRADEKRVFNRVHNEDSDDDADDDFEKRDFNKLHADHDDVSDDDDEDDDEDEDEDFKVQKEKRAELVDLLKKALRNL